MVEKCNTARVWRLGDYVAISTEHSEKSLYLSTEMAQQFGTAILAMTDDIIGHINGNLGTIELPHKGSEMYPSTKRVFEIHARRWFQKSAGNTYHSVVVTHTNTGSLMGETVFVYGYGDQYLTTAFELLKREGHIPIKTTFTDFNQYMIALNIVVDVPRKKDL